jgi:hypothetical protein
LGRRSNTRVPGMERYTADDPGRFVRRMPVGM